MIRSVPKSFVVFLISSDTKAIAKIKFTRCHGVKKWSPSMRLQTFHEKLREFSILEPCGGQEDFPK